MSGRSGLCYHPQVMGARVVLDPAGDHRLRVETENGIMVAEYDTGQVLQLEQVIRQFRTLTITADGGPDFHNRKIVPVEFSR